jgi:uncharacterized membrane protein
MVPEEQPEQILNPATIGTELAALRARLDVLERQVKEIEGLRPSVTSSGPPTAPSAPPPPRVAAAGFPTVAAQAKGSIESRLGSQFFSWIGILALLFAATAFLKLAIENQWIGPIGRVTIGMVLGAALIVVSERFRRRNLAAFSYALKAIGSGVLYLSLWAAFQLYHLLPAGVALGAMVLVTGWNAYMAWLQDSELLSGFALVGGFITPLLLSTGGNHETFLFVYLLALDLATVMLVRLKPWPRLLTGAFPATVAYFIGWYVQFYSADQLAVTSVFILLFWVIFASVPIPWRKVISEDRDRSPQTAGSLIEQIFLPLGAASFGALALYSSLQDSGHHDLLPWLMVVFAAAYLGLTRLPQPATSATIHLSLAIVFLTIAIPLKASGHWVTVAWLVEGTALLWAGARLEWGEDSDSSTEPYRVLRWLGSGALLLGCIAVLARPFFSIGGPLPAFLNTRFATAMVAVVMFALSAWIAVRQARGRDSRFAQWMPIAGACIVAINVIAVLAWVREIDAFWSQGALGADAELQQAMSISAFLMLYGGALLAVGFWKRSAFVRWQALGLIVFTIAKTFLYDTRSLSQGYRVLSFMALGALLMGVSFAYQKDWLALRDPEGGTKANEEQQ